MNAPISAAMWTSIWQHFLGSLCLLCRENLSGHHARLQLCRHCLTDLPWRAADPDSTVSEHVSRQVVPLTYEEPASSWVLRAKQSTGLVEARVLGMLLADAVMEDLAATPGSRPDLIVPVPLSRRRLLRRGHNQAVLIAEPVARLLQVPLNRDGVRRVTHTSILPGLSPPARRQKVAGAFHTRLDPRGLTIAIVDDVVTTGATARELAACLKAAGAADVHLYVPTAPTAPSPPTAPPST